MECIFRERRLEMRAFVPAFLPITNVRNTGTSSNWVKKKERLFLPLGFPLARFISFVP